MLQSTTFPGTTTGHGVIPVPAHISMNWRGRPLTSHEVVAELIGATTTRTGLTDQADRDPGTYPSGVKISDTELASVPLTPHGFHGERNYTISPIRGVSPWLANVIQLQTLTNPREVDGRCCLG